MTTDGYRPAPAGFPPEGDLFAIDDEVVSYSDLVVVAMLNDDWRPFVTTSWLGAYLATCRDVDEAALRQAAAKFRVERHLEAADDLRAWLAARSLTRSDWRGSLVRAVLLAADGDDLAGAENVPALDDAAILDDTAFLDVLRVDAICRKLWAGAAMHAVDWLAAARLAARVPPQGAPPGPPGAPSTAAIASSTPYVSPQRAVAIAGWRAQYGSVRAQVASDEPISLVLHQRELDWTSFDIEELVVGSESAAREALLCSRDDSLEPDVIHQMAGGSLSAWRARASSFAPAVAGALVGATAGDVVGPFRNDEKWSVMWVRGRHRPALADDALRKEAADEVMRQALEREITGHLRWLGPQ
jgi:hypothetical protein